MGAAVGGGGRASKIDEVVVDSSDRRVGVVSDVEGGGEVGGGGDGFKPGIYFEMSGRPNSLSVRQCPARCRTG